MKRILVAVILLLLMLFLMPLLALPADTASGANPNAAVSPAPTATLPADVSADSSAVSSQLPAKSAGPSLDAQTSVRLLINGTVRTVPMDEYLFHVVAAEMPASFELEALKAQAIAARTYALYKIQNGPSPNHPNADLCTNSNCCSAYITEAKMKQAWGASLEEYRAKVLQAVSETDGQAILYNGQPINAVFHSSSSGTTEKAELVWGAAAPYLSSVFSPENGETVPNYESTVKVPVAQFRSAILQTYPDADLSGSPSQWFGRADRSHAGRVLRIFIGGVPVAGSSLRSLFGLRSTAFSVSVESSNVVFQVTGYGHGVGMSQYGANVYALRGWNCYEILTWYYQGTVIGSWKR